jgi:hypothetical protein
VQLRLRFDGVDSAYHVWANGRPVGYSQGSRNAAEFDVTSFVQRQMVNEVFVRVYQWCDGSYIEDQDQWWLSGTYSTVFHPMFITHISNRYLSRRLFPRSSCRGKNRRIFYQDRSG